MAKFIGKYYTAIGFMLIIIALLSGCYTNKKATKQVTKAIEKKPLIAAKLTRSAYPCITVASDTAIIYKDSIIIVDCPPSTTEYFTIIDTLNKVDTIYKSVKVPIKVQLPSKVVTKYIEDSAKIILIAGEKRTLQDSLLLANNTITKHEKNKKNIWWVIGRLFWFWQVWVIIGLTLLYIFRKPILMLL